MGVTLAAWLRKITLCMAAAISSRSAKAACLPACLPSNPQVYPPMGRHEGVKKDGAGKGNWGTLQDAEE